MTRVWTYDIETLINCFTVTFVDVDDESRYFHFVVHKLRDDRELLKRFINTDVKGLISFNGVRFDNPILNDLMCWANGTPAETVAKRAYENAQMMIEMDMTPKMNVYKSGIPELDLYLLYHFNNEARRTSLKWIECHLGMDNIQEMPHPHSKPVTTLDEINTILKYNLNDCIATTRLYHKKKTRDLIDLRKWAKKEYGIPSINISNAQMGETIFLRTMGDCPAPDTTVRTINVGDLILPEIKFTSKQFNSVLDHFRKLKFRTNDPEPKVGKQVIFSGMKYYFGGGGLHAVRPDSLYNETVDSIDVKSFYPNLAISYGFKPKHLGESFTTTYRKLYQDRVNSTNPVANNGLKEALNSVFGKSNSVYSPLYDPDFTFSITVNGQLLMAMLAEKIETMNAGKVIMVNTDGMEVLVKDRDLYNRIIESWKTKTRMTVTTSQYNRLMIRDVNNYIGRTFKGDVKIKGIYEIEKDWHKDPSMKICAIAIKNWFIDDMPIEKTIQSLKSSSYFYMFKRAKTGKYIALTRNGDTEIEVPKTIRYLITKVGFTLYQVTDAMKSKAHADGAVTFCNDLTDPDREFDLNNLDLNWYIRETRKLIVEGKTTLF